MRRILHEASFIASSMLAAMTRSAVRRPDVLVVTTPPLALSLSAMLLSRMWKIPFIQHVPDLQPDAAVDLGMLREGRLTDVLYGLERMGYRKAALVSTLTEAMRDKIISKGIAAEKVVLFSDWASPELFQVPAHGGGAEFRRSLGVGNELLVVHAGNMGVKQGLEVILGAAERSRERSRYQVFAGRRRLGAPATRAACEVSEPQQSNLCPVAAGRSVSGYAGGQRHQPRDPTEERGRHRVSLEGYHLDVVCPRHRRLGESGQRGRARVEGSRRRRLDCAGGSGRLAGCDRRLA